MSKEEIINKYGLWSAHNIKLGTDNYTIDSKQNYDHFKLARIKQIVMDHYLHLSGSRSTLRVLDLACLEGLYTIELAMEGMQTVGIEGREQNIVKARFAATELKLKSIQFIQDDVRKIDSKTYGEFDVVLCLGILYHISKEDIVAFLENISSMCKYILIIDSHVSLQDIDRILYKNLRIAGKNCIEHSSDASEEEVNKAIHSALDKKESFYFTQNSLIELLGALDFTSIYRCYYPFEPGEPGDRMTILCIKGQSVNLNVFPEFDANTREFTNTAGVGNLHRGNSLIFRILRHAKRRGSLTGKLIRRVKNLVNKLRG